MIQVDGRAHEPTFLRGSTVSPTSNVLPLQTLAGLLQQPGGLQLGIDITSVGYRVRTGTGYPQLYSTLLADRGAAGQRSTHLIVRLDIRESIRGLTYRRSIGSAAAAATERIVKALEQQGIRAAPLNGEEQDAVLEQLSVGLALAPARPVPAEDADDLDDLQAVEDFEDFEAAMRERDEQRVAALAVGVRHRAPTGADDEHPRARRVRLRSEVGWNTINAKPGFLTSYYFSPEDITSDVFNQMWSLRSDDIVHVTDAAPTASRRPGVGVGAGAHQRPAPPGATADTVPQPPAGRAIRRRAARGPDESAAAQAADPRAGRPGRASHPDRPDGGPGRRGPA